MKRCSGLILLSLMLLLLSGSSLTAAETSQKQANITCTAQSPVDGSLWMGTNGDGLLRMGRNGRHILYNKANGQLNSDVIQALSFETGSNVLFILDGNGSIWTYSSTAGFQEKEGFTSPVLCLQVSQNGSLHWAATAENLYRFTSKSAPEKCLSLPAAAQKIVTGEDGALWIITKDEALHVDENLNITQQNGVFSLDVSNLNAFNYETSTPEAVKDKRSPVYWLYIVLAVLACALGALIYFRRVKPGSQSVAAVQPVEPAPEEKPSAAKDASKPKVAKPIIPAENPAIPSYEEIRKKMEASPFGATVLSIIDSHLEDPNFGVEQISETMELSRIHLNRKLKSETDFSPSTVLKAARMNQAVHLLMDGKHTIADVAARCGFSTPSYFSTAFKEYFGASPSDYMGPR